MSLYIDLSEFLANPITSGIQRVVGEICKHMPPEEAIPVRLHSGQYFALSRSLIPAIGRHFSAPGESNVMELRRLAAIECAVPVRLSQTDTVLIPEVFLDRQRIAFFRNMPDHDFDRCRFIVYDLLPLTHPEYFPSDEFLKDIYGYFQVIRRATCCGFISEYTRDVYCRRLKRTRSRDGVVLPLGCDSLGRRPERTAVNRPLTFTLVGTIEPRKNHALVLETFEPLLRQIPGLCLSFVGNMGWVDAKFAQRVYALANDKNSGFRFHPAPDDGVIRNHIEQSRATIYLSAAEGYGLPPVESLWCGTPVIASTEIPSLQRLGSAGIHYVEPLDATQLREAVLAFVDDAYANEKTEETIQLDLPTWTALSKEVLRWCARESEDMARVTSDLQVYRGYTDADLALFDRFSGHKRLSATPGFVTDFLGVKTRTTFVRGVEHLDGKVLGIPVPDDGWHSEAIEWIGLLKSITSASRRLTAMELGAGWGPWSVAAAAAARVVGVTDTRLCAVEVDPGHFDFMLRHFRDNGLTPEAHRLIQAGVGVEAGKGRFPKLADPSADFGSRPQTSAEACQTDYVGREFPDWVEVDIIPISELLRSEPVWDLVHVDVQGWEVDLCSAASALLDERVRWLVIGTHDAKLHGNLISLMFQRGWILENEKPPRFAWTNQAPTLVAMTTHDGTQVWRNPTLGA